MAPDVEVDLNLQDALTIPSQHCVASPWIDINYLCVWLK